MKDNNIGENRQNTKENSGGNLTNYDISQITNTSIDFLNYAKEVYSYLEDDISKGIFEHRLLQNVSLTNFSGLHPYVNEYLKSYINEFSKKFEKINDNDFIVIYGCSIQGQALFKELNRQNNILFCDRNHDVVNSVFDIPVISPQELIEKHNNAIIMLCVGEANDSVLKFLLDKGILENNIVEIGVTDVKSQYFDELIKFSKNEIFIDAGGFDGETAVRFAITTNYNYDKIFVFEPDLRNQVFIKNNVHFNNLQNTNLLPIGLWDKQELLKFCSERHQSSSISLIGDIEIKCDTLDNVLGDEPVTFIKMDIEGAELNALKGAKNLITKYKPKLAISIYHKPEDIIDIPMYIKSLVPEYKLYIRHYSTTYTETVLYAIID